MRGSFNQGARTIPESEAPSFTSGGTLHEPGARPFDARLRASPIAKELKKPGLFQLPGLVKIEKKTIPAQKAIKDWKNPFTGEIGTKPAKPASTKVKVRALKKLKDMA